MFPIGDEFMKKVTITCLSCDMITNLAGNCKLKLASCQLTLKRTRPYSKNSWLISYLLLCLLLVTNCSNAKQINLNASQRKHIERYLFPLPQNVIVGSVAVAVKPQELQLIFDHSLNSLAKQYLQDFCQRWQTSSKIKLTTNSEIKKNKKVIVYIAINKQYSPLVTAEQHDVIKLKKLNSVPNSAQAYSINCLKTNKYNTFEGFTFT